MIRLLHMLKRQHFWNIKTFYLLVRDEWMNGIMKLRTENVHACGMSRESYFTRLHPAVSLTWWAMQHCQSIHTNATMYQNVRERLTAMR